MIPAPSPPFEFSATGKAKQSIIRIMARAASLGIRDDVDRWFQHMDVEARYHPRSWGDPIRNFRSLQQVLFRGRIGPLLAYYSVHDRLPMVILIDVAVEPDHPLARTG